MAEMAVLVYILVFHLLPHITEGSDEGTGFIPITRIMQSTTEAPVPVVPDIVLTLAVIGGCALLGLGIAKLSDVIYDRHIKKNYKSKQEVTDQALRQLRARIAIMRMKPDPKIPELKSAKRAATVWMSRTAGKKKDVDAKDPNITNEIGKTHVPGISIKIDDHHEAEPSKAGEVKDPVTAFEEDNSRKDSVVVSHTYKKHPLETITVKAKLGGPLPPVAIHDQPHLNKYHYPV